MTVVFLHGHGSWKPEFGYTQVPRNCSVTFYTHFAKLLNQTMVRLILNGTFAGQFERTIGAFHAVPNLRMSSLTQGQYDWADATFVPGGRVLYRLPPAPPTQRFFLSQMMQAFTDAWGRDAQIDYHWLCCQALGLDKVGGGEVGLNASDRTAQTGHEGEYLFKWKDGNGVEQTKWVKSNSSIHH